MDRIIKTILTTMLFVEVLLLIAIIGCAFGTLNLDDTPFIGYLIKGSSQSVFWIIRITINTAMLLLVSNHIFKWVNGDKISEKFISVGKASLLASITTFVGLLLSSRLILGIYGFYFDFLGYVVMYLYCVVLLESVGPVFCPITPHRLLLNWVTYEDDEEQKEETQEA